MAEPLVIPDLYEPCPCYCHHQDGKVSDCRCGDTGRVLRREVTWTGDRLPLVLCEPCAGTGWFCDQHDRAKCAECRSFGGSQHGCRECLHTGSRPCRVGDTIPVASPCQWCEGVGCSTIDRGENEDRPHPLDCGYRGYVPVGEGTVKSIVPESFIQDEWLVGVELPWPNERRYVVTLTVEPTEAQP